MSAFPLLPPAFMLQLPAAFQLSTILFDNQNSPQCWRGLQLDRQGALNLTRHLITSEYIAPIMDNFQYLTPFLPDPELEALMLDRKFIDKLDQSLAHNQTTNWTLIRLKGLSNPKLQEELIRVAEQRKAVNFRRILTKTPGNLNDTPIASFTPTDPKLFTWLKNICHTIDGEDYPWRHLKAFFLYIESEELFAKSKEFVEKYRVRRFENTLVYHKNCHKDKKLFITAMTQWLEMNITCIDKPQGTLPLELIKSLPNDLLIAMYSHFLLSGYLPNYPDLSKKCLFDILHNPNERTLTTIAINRARGLKPAPLESYRQAAKLMPDREPYLRSLFLLNNMQMTTPPSEINWKNFVKSYEYRQLPEEIKPLPTNLQILIKGGSNR